MNAILGDGITGYIIGACLDYNNEDFRIYGNDSYKPPSILLLKYNDNEELRQYFYIFGIDYNKANLKKYCTKIKVGYTTDFCKTIVDKPTEDMIKNYLEKQHREPTKSAMSDLNSSYDAIDLKEVYYHLKKHYYNKYIKIDNIKEALSYLRADNIYNTIFETTLNDNKPYTEYVALEENNILDYNYVYDCNPKSTIKRYTKNTSEYISEPIEYSFETNNFYNEPTIYTITKPKSGVTWYDISRRSTKTQLKQEDIINYMVKYE